MTNAEAVDLASKLGVPVKSHSSSLNEAYADMVRRRAARDGLTRDEQPDEPEAEKKPAQEGGRQEGRPPSRPAAEPAVAEPADAGAEPPLRTRQPARGGARRSSRLQPARRHRRAGARREPRRP